MPTRTTVPGRAQRRATLRKDTGNSGEMAFAMDIYFEDVLRKHRRDASIWDLYRLWLILRQKIKFRRAAFLAESRLVHGLCISF